jgi:hypothetical protein
MIAVIVSRYFRHLLHGWHLRHTAGYFVRCHAAAMLPAAVSRSVFFLSISPPLLFSISPMIRHQRQLFIELNTFCFRHFFRHIHISFLRHYGRFRRQLSSFTLSISPPDYATLRRYELMLPPIRYLALAISLLAADGIFI